MDRVWRSQAQTEPVLQCCRLNQERKARCSKAQRSVERLSEAEPGKMIDNIDRIPGTPEI